MKTFKTRHLSGYLKVYVFRAKPHIHPKLCNARIWQMDRSTRPLENARSNLLQQPYCTVFHSSIWFGGNLLTERILQCALATYKLHAVHQVFSSWVSACAWNEWGSWSGRGRKFIFAHPVLTPITTKVRPQEHEVKNKAASQPAARHQK